MYICINVLSSFSSTLWLPPFLLFLTLPEICHSCRPHHSLALSKTKQIVTKYNLNIIIIITRIILIQSDINNNNNNNNKNNNNVNNDNNNNYIIIMIAIIIVITTVIIT